MTFEYSLVAGVNDQPVHAQELASRLKGFPCHVNLIPVNPIKERDFKQSMPQSVMEFKRYLKKSCKCYHKKRNGRRYQCRLWTA